MWNDMYRNPSDTVRGNQQMVDMMKRIMSDTHTPNVYESLANFAGLYQLPEGQIIAANTSGVGTKLKLALTLNRHDTIGIDCVAMCVNNIVCHGAKPLFFMNYIASSKINVDRVSTLVSSLAEGCIQARCAMLGGETMEIPGFYKLDEYNLNGFVVGLVEEDKLIDGSSIRAGDKLIGLSSNGVHTSGFSLISKIFSLDAVALNHYVDTLQTNLGEELIRPSRIYSETILSLTRRFTLKGIAHIEQGGFVDNIPRMLPDGLQANIFMDSWPILPVFEIIRAANKSSMEDLFSVFNMGIGMVIAVSPDYAEAVVRCAHEMNENAYIIGEVAHGDQGVVIHNPI